MQYSEQENKEIAVVKLKTALTKKGPSQLMNNCSWERQIPTHFQIYSKKKIFEIREDLKRQKGKIKRIAY
jgi:hypothetical protein